MLCSERGKENSDAGQIKCSRGPHLTRESQVPPCLDEWSHVEVQLLNRKAVCQSETFTYLTQSSDKNTTLF